MAGATMAGHSLRRPTSLCALVEGGHQADTFLVPWILEGVHAGESVIVLGGPSAVRSTRDGVARAMPGTFADASLELVPWTHLYPWREAFDAACALRNTGRLLEAAAVSGRPVRVAADMDWILTSSSGGRAAADFAIGMDALVRRHDVAMLCCYDLMRLSGSLLLDILTAHPLTFARGSLHASPFYRGPLRTAY